MLNAASFTSLYLSAQPAGSCVANPCLLERWSKGVEDGPGSSQSARRWRDLQGWSRLRGPPVRRNGVASPVAIATLSEAAKLPGLKRCEICIESIGGKEADRSS
ncbi:hypothetical protein BS78_K071500 [Paspalum vaginatum]|uniref:Uncharacterized protein n=1 Tax=Paspalum vaginatum TaxID=158149 RepID=A0A9W7X6Y8_9POAL|nr:hypothetical protein BS78_K071500 [Paspalum vaginatum]